MSTARRRRRRTACRPRGSPARAQGAPRGHALRAGDDRPRPLPHAPFAAALWRPAAVLVVGTLGLATDAIDHLLSYAMTAPGVDQSAQVEVMEFMQGPALVLIAPLIASWFAAVTDVIDTRTVGLVTLWTVAAAQAWLGVALWTRSIRPRTNSSRRGQGRATVTSP